MIKPQDIELIAMILQRASVNPIEAEWVNAKLDELRALFAQGQADAQRRDKPTSAAEGAGHGSQDEDG